MQSVPTAPAPGRSRLRFRLLFFLAVSSGVGAWLLPVLVLVVAWFRLDRLVLGEGESVERPTLRVVTGYPGASADVVEQVITAPLEVQPNGVEGVQSVRC